MMDLFRRFASEAPPARSFSEDKPTLLVCWWCTMYAMTIIMFRVCGRYIRAERFFLDDKIMLASILPMMTRMALVHVVLLFGTSNAVTEGLSAENLHRRQIGSGMVLLLRVMDVIFLWTIKYSTFICLRSLTDQVRQKTHRMMLHGVQILIGLSLIAVIISTFAECHPFSNYWLVAPDPGPKCRQAPAQFITFSISHVLTNLALAFFPIPLILKSRIPTRRKITTLSLLALPIISVAYTIGTMPRIMNSGFLQHTRSLFGSLDVLLNVFWSNAVVLSALLQDKGFKKAKYKHRYEYDPKDRNHFTSSSSKTKGVPRGREPWDSDEELIADQIPGGKSTRGESRAAVVTRVCGDGNRNDAIEMISLPQAKMSKKGGSITVAHTWEVQVEELKVPAYSREHLHI